DPTAKPTQGVWPTWLMSASGQPSQHVRFAPNADLPPDLRTTPPPAFRERRHRCLARHLVSVHRLTIFVGQDGPQPRRSNRGRCSFHDPPDNSAIGQHVEVVIVPFAGGAPRGGAFES